MSDNNKTKEYLNKFTNAMGDGLIEGIQNARKQHQDSLNEAYYSGFYNSMEKAVVVLNEVGLDEDIIINCLINHWDLRRSEAEGCVQRLLHENVTK